MKPLTRTIGLAGAALVWSAGAPAQSTATLLRVGEAVHGALLPTSPKLAQLDDAYFCLFRFDGAAGKRYAVSMKSAAFDTYLLVGKTTAGVTDYFATDDDGGDSTDSFLRFRADNGGPYVIVASAAEQEVGAFDIVVRELTERPLVVRPVAIGDSAAGRLGAETAVYNDGEFVHDVYTFRAAKGRVLRAVTKTSLTAYALFGRVQQGVFVPLPNSRAGTSVVIPEDGEYAVAVVGEPRDTAVSYIVRVTEPGAAPARNLQPGQDMVGTLDTGLDLKDPAYANQYYHEWTYRARKGERVTVTLGSDDFDSFLVVGRRVNGRFEKIGEDDDGGVSTDSRLTFLAPQDGEYLIRAEALEGEDGRYTLRAEPRQPVTHRLERASIAANQEVTSRLEESDEIADDGSPYDEWIYAAQAGERLTITMRTKDFDSYLSVGVSAGGKFVEFSNNDDAAENAVGAYVSRVVVVAPTKGDLVIRANTFGPEQTGAYTLKVERTSTSGSAR